MMTYIEDDIIWKLSPGGEYLVASAYKARFLGAISTDMKKVV
jgi:hypothetical protein